MPETDDGARTTTAVDLRRLFDDASQFPPAKLDLDAAVAAHREWRAGPRSALVGRFLCPAARAEALAAALQPGDGWEIGLVVGSGADPGAARQALDGAPATVTSIEIALATGDDAVAAWRAAFPAAECFVEGMAEDVPAIAALGGKAKIRCGGVTPDAVPSTPAVAAFIFACAAARTPFKATAGLHQPLRHDGQHGFLNLLAAAGAAREGATREDVEALLSATEPAALRLRDAGRELFEAFGTCSIAEPIEGLVDLGLLDG